jgi:aminopeptidase
MTPERLAAFARVVAGFCQDARAGDRVLVESTPSADAAAAAVARALTARGADVDVATFGAAWQDPERVATLTGYVSLRAIGDTSTAPKRPVPASSQRLKMTLRKTTTVLPDAGLADRAGMTMGELEDYYASLLHLDDADPVRGFHALRDEQETLLTRLRAARTVRIEGDGTDLTLSVDGRGWQNSYGRRNIPSGEMFTSPIEDTADGVIRFDVPSYYLSAPVRGVRLEFRRGEVVSASAEEGDDALQAAIATDAGARRLGELGIGGNRRMERFLGSTLFDEKVAGTVHLALGRSYPQTGGVNESAIHWDLITDLRSGGRLSLDGRPFIDDGHFVGV